MYRNELRRKSLHLAGLIIPLAYVWVGEGPILVLLGIGSLLGVVGQILQVRSVWFNRRIDELFGSMMRSGERTAVGDPLTLNGATWMAIAAFLTFLCFPRTIGIAAFTLAVVCDTAAALIGIRFGRHTIGSTRKTLEGSAAFLVSGLLVVALIPDLPFWIGAAGVAGATTAEGYSTFINDNLLIPFTSGPIMLALQYVA